MAFNVRDNKTGGDFEKMAPGLKQAVCSHLVDLGTQETLWGDKRRVMLLFEFSETMKDGRPFMLQKEYNPTLVENSNLRADLETWRGRQFSNQELGLDQSGNPDPNLAGFDLESVVGANCFINVGDKTSKQGKIYSEIKNINPLPPEYPKIKPTGQPVPDWIQDKAKKGKAISDLEAFNQAPPPPPPPPPAPAQQAPGHAPAPDMSQVSAPAQPGVPGPAIQDDDLPF